VRRFERPVPWSADLDLGLVTIDGGLDPDVADDVATTVGRYGFAVVRSAPAGSGAAAIDGRRRDLLRFARALGTPVVQSPRNELVEDIKDFSDLEESDDRGYRSGGELAPHSDPPTLIVLHCVRPARVGGESSLVSVPAIVDRMGSERPDLVEELFADWPGWRVAGQAGNPVAGPDDVRRPVLATRDGVLSCVLYRPFIELAAAALGTPLGSRVEALDRFDRWATDEQFGLRFTLAAGETLVLHNRSVLHARTDYRDWPEPDRRRHLLRVWIDAPERFPVHPAHELGDIFADDGAVGARPPVGSAQVQAQ
jgi:hypothetical protein